MSVPISAKTEARLMATADAERVSVDALVERLIGEWEELSATIQRTEGYIQALSRQQITGKLERGCAQSERDDVVDGDVFVAKLMSDIDDLS